MVDQAVGCYRVRGAAADSVDGLLLRLDRDSIRLGRYRAQPPLPRYSDPGWQWIGHDSITVDWPEIHHALTLRLRVRGDSLVGRSSVGPGAASWYGTRHAPQRVVATRIRCNANPS